MNLIPQAVGDDSNRKWKESVRELQKTVELEKGLLRSLIIEQKRIDVLASWILGINLRPHHLQMLDHQDRHPRSLILSWRGSGKTTACTVIRAIHEILLDADIRILIASNSHTNATGMLDEVKGHFKSEKFIETFGDFSNSDKWDSYAINVAHRKIIAKENTINTTGTETALPSRHWELILADDLVNEATSRTEGQRDKLHTWFYKTLDPCLMPDGRLHVNGTCYHHDDLHAELEREEMKESTLRIPIEDKKGKPVWPEMYSKKWIKNKEKAAGKINFGSQYRLDTHKLARSPFKWENISNYYTIRKNEEGEKVIVRDGIEVSMKSLMVFQAADPSTGTVGPGGSLFAHATMGIDPDGFLYLLDIYYSRIPFATQLVMIEDKNLLWQPVRVGIESNAFQKVLYDSLKTTQVPAKSIITIKDKKTRVFKRTAIFEQNRVWIQRAHSVVQDHLVSVLEKGNKKDIFDALDMACELALGYQAKRHGRRRRAREDEPGLNWGRRR